MGTLLKWIQLLYLSSVSFGKHFCHICSERLIPESTTTNFTLKGNFSCTEMFTIHNNKNNPTTRGNEYLTMDQCASFKKECIRCIEEKKDLILS